MTLAVLSAVAVWIAWESVNAYAISLDLSCRVPAHLPSEFETTGKGGQEPQTLHPSGSYPANYQLGFQERLQDFLQPDLVRRGLSTVISGMSCAHVIDTIQVTDSLRQNAPGLVVPFRGDGLNVILDPAQSDDVADVTGKQETIQRPNGNISVQVVSGTQKNPAGVLSLFFEGMTPDLVPRLSSIVWDV